MDLILVVLVLAIIGVILEMIQTKLKMDDIVLWLIRVVIVISVIMILVKMFGKLVPNVLS
jgi:type III secretory pathway component EscS